MMSLDTNVVVALINRPDSRVRGRYKAAIGAGQTCVVSSVVVFEMRYGAARSQRRTENDAVLSGFLATGPGVLVFDADDAETAGTIRATLEAAGTPIGPYDLLIAAQALRLGATLVTANVREFERVQGLRVEDWTA